MTAMKPAPRGLTPLRPAPAPAVPLAETQLVPVRAGLRAEVVRLALAEVGVREEGGNNQGERIREYQRATWLAPGPWPWCAAFVCWVIQQALSRPAILHRLRLVEPVDNWRPRTAGAFDFQNWARKRGLTIKTENQQAKAGDLVIFDFSHIGIVVADQTGRQIETVEGNTNGRGDRDSLSGDGVWRKTRDYKLTLCYITLPD